VLTVEVTEPSDLLCCIYLCVCHRVVLYKVCSQEECHRHAQPPQVEISLVSAEQTSSE